MSLTVCLCFAGARGRAETDVVGPSSQPDESQEEDRDADTEAELAGVVKDDPLAAYDVDVTQEGLAIQEYLMLLQQQQQ